MDTCLLDMCVGYFTQDLDIKDCEKYPNILIFELRIIHVRTIYYYILLIQE